MSLVTRCPECATTFKVVRDQLKISDGWVRCGRCSHVFDAQSDLREVPDEVVPPIVADPAATPNVQASIGTDASMPTPAASIPPDPAGAKANDPPPDRRDFHGPPEADELAALFPDEALTAQIPAPATAEREPPLPRWRAHDPFPDIDLNLPARDVGLHSVRAPASPAKAEPAVEQAQLQKALRRARSKAAKASRARQREERRAVAPVPAPAAPVVRAAAEDAAPGPAAWRTSRPDALAVDALPSFLRPATHRFGWPTLALGGARRAPWLVAGALATLLLLLQLTHFNRNLLVARQPSLLPALAGFCELAGCRLAPVRHLADIRIDGASFARERGAENAFRLSFTLRSVSEMPLAMPSIELTLLDTQERAVIRRVLDPFDYGAPAVMPAHGERSASLPVTLDTAQLAGLPPVAGFLVEALYP